jgi:hypothetical protein
MIRHSVETEEIVKMPGKNPGNPSLHRQEPVRTRRRFPIGWLLAIVLPLLVVAGMLFVFSQFLYGVEYYSPVVDLEEFVETVKAKDTAKIMEICDLKTDPFNRLDEYAAFFDEYYGAKVDHVVFVERKLQETGQDVFYDVRINKKTVQKFKLTKTGEKRLYLFDTWKLSLIDEIPRKSVVIHTVPGVALKVNGQPIGDGQRLSQTGYVIDEFDGIKDDAKNISYQSYQVDGLVHVSSIEAVADTGEICTLERLDDEDNVEHYVVRRPIPDAYVDELQAFTLTATKKYSEFVAKHITFSGLTPYLYQNTALYDNLREFYNGWFTGHDSYGFENTSYFGMEWYDDTHCRIGIEMNFYVYKSGKRFDYPIKYNVYLLKVGGKWLLADLSIQ